MKEALNLSEDPYEPEQKAPADLDWTPYPAGPMNQWPETPSDFRKVLCEYRDACLSFSKGLMRLVALSLDLDEEYFNNLTTFPMAGLRPLHYPPQEASDDIGLGAHVDYSCLSPGAICLITAECISRVYSSQSVIACVSS